MVWRSFWAGKHRFLIGIIKNTSMPKRLNQAFCHAVKQFNTCTTKRNNTLPSHAMKCLISWSHRRNSQHFNISTATCFSEHLFHHVPNAFMAWQGSWHLSLSRSSRSSIYCREAGDCRLSDFVDGGIMVESFRILQIFSTCWGAWCRRPDPLRMQSSDNLNFASFDTSEVKWCSVVFSACPLLLVTFYTFAILFRARNIFVWGRRTRASNKKTESVAGPEPCDDLGLWDLSPEHLSSAPNGVFPVDILY